MRQATHQPLAAICLRTASTVAGPVLGPMDDWLLLEGTHERLFDRLGAHVIEHEGERGVHFAVWAPNARRVSVVGDFNGWDGRVHPMRARGSSGIWELFVPGLVPGDAYKYEIRTHAGVVLPLKCDPYARGAQMRPDNASLVTAALPERKALPAGRAQAQGSRPWTRRACYARA